MNYSELDTIRQKRDQSPKQQNKKDIQKAMHKKSKGIGRPTKNITLVGESPYGQVDSLLVSRLLSPRQKSD
jgi:hypothetical protein